jgi:hypothetical protein
MVSSPLMTKSFKTPMHVKSITWKDLYTLLETHRNKPHPKPRPEPPPASSMVSHGSTTDGPEIPVEQSVNSSKSYKDNFVFSGSRGQSVSSVQTVRHLLADGPSVDHGWSAVTIHPPYTILYNSYKIAYRSEKCEILLLVSNDVKNLLKMSFSPN